MSDMIQCNVNRMPRRSAPSGSSELMDMFLNGWTRSLYDAEVYRPWRPPVDVAETDAHYAITLEAPGLDMESLDITFGDGLLDVKGEKHKETEIGECCHCSERYAGAFERRFRISGVIDVEKIEATFKDGILRVVIPKGEETPPRKIEVH